ncbi:MAG: M15 family metallopeptidase [Arcobacter sp.]|nr:M15 family metallopeptidase [Arcobacter sp.]
MKVNQTDRDLNKLASPFKEKVKDFLKDERVGDIFVTEGYRSQERQEYLYNQTPKVTWTLTSMHTKGLAIDIAFY